MNKVIQDWVKTLIIPIAMVIGMSFVGWWRLDSLEEKIEKQSNFSNRLGSLEEWRLIQSPKLSDKNMQKWGEVLFIIPKLEEDVEQLENRMNCVENGTPPRECRRF